MIETRLLHQFIAVAEELHFHRAAARLNMAQPPLSQAIRRLEEEIGFPLFERTNRRVALTPAGDAFLICARNIVKTLSDGVAQCRRVAQGIDGTLNIHFINITPYTLLLKAFREFQSENSTIEFCLQEATTQEQISALEEGNADIGFLREAGRNTPQLHFERILRENILLALPAGHRLASQDCIPLSLLKDDPFVVSPRALGQGFHDQLVGLCHAAGFQPRIVQEARQMQTLVGLVASGFGAALLPESAISGKRDDVTFHPISVDASEALCSLDLYMAWRRDKALPARDRLLAKVREEMGLILQAS